MSEILIRVCWLVLAAVHLAPAGAFFSPELVSKLYGTAPEGDVGVLLVHRGALFLALVAAGLWAAFLTGARPLVALLMAISVLGFLLAYARAGMPPGPLLTIALFDVVATIPLAIVAFAAWHERRGRPVASNT